MEKLDEKTIRKIELDEETIRKIELAVSCELIKQSIKPTRLIFDTTNFYTHIEHGEKLPKKVNQKINDMIRTLSESD